jgi:ribonuclease HII
VGVVDQKKIDEIGIVAANILAMQKALAKLNPQPDYVLIDAVKLDYRGLPSTSMIKGDHKIRSVAAASIISKVSRDQIMDEMDEQYPAYGFKHHKGYGTNHHFAMLNKYGVCDLHRKTWEPMKYLIEEKNEV